MADDKRRNKMPGGIPVGTEQVLPGQVVDLRSIQIILARYDFAAEYIKEKVVLDVACGAGYGSRFLLDRGAKKVVGGDNLAEALAAAQKFYGRKGVQFFMVNATRLPFADNSFDVVVSMETIEHLELQEDFLAECRRVLKEGGVFICSTPNRMMSIDEARKHNCYHVHELTADEFRELTARYFNDIKLYGMDYWREEKNTLLTMKTKIATIIRAHLPKFYQIIEWILGISIMRGHFIRLNQINNCENILSAKYKPTLLSRNSPVPKTVIITAKNGKVLGNS